ncbi:hypothetical protein ACFWIB_42225 [Streptomyces sp. NPDC127051]|uniref:hypothetical protein n=1 Tax=Streptomyces sp. NPDC127051 TaxID=3347119 RepID=UPI003656F34D
MTAEQMAAQCGIHWTRLRQIARGYARVNDPEGTRLKTINRTTHVAIMSLQYEEPNRLGARVPAVWVQRRLQALAAIGFSARILTEMLGWESESAHKLLSDMTRGRGRKRHACWTYFQQIDALYDKLKFATAEDYNTYRPNVIRSWARKSGFAPPHCWDPDNIDDVEAIPEWTGMCGTVEGARIHQREEIPVCKPCLQARQAYERERRARAGHGIKE